MEPNNSEKLQLQKTQLCERINRTMSAAEYVHCGKGLEDEKQKEKAVKDGLWVTLVHKCSDKELVHYIRKSKKATRCSKEVVTTKSKETEKERLTRSLVVLYEGSMVTARKYQKLRSHEKESMKHESILPYKKLMLIIGRRHHHDLKVKPAPEIKGLTRDLERLLIEMSSFYLKLVPDDIDWFEEEGVFIVSVGGDAAPMQTIEGEDSGTSILLSLLNSKHRVASPKHNHLLLGGHCAEKSEHLLNLLTMFSKEMEIIEGNRFTVEGQQIQFRCEMVSCDQSFLATVSGELTNSATFPSSFANVKNDQFGVTDGTVGSSESDTWQPWNYHKRLTDADHIAKLKSKSKKPVARTKITAEIAKRNSRQEFVPALGKYIEKARIDPLHITNLAWQHWLKRSFTLIVNRSSEIGSLKKIPNANQIPICHLKGFLDQLAMIRLKRIRKQILKHLAERGLQEVLTLRLTGEESKILCQHCITLMEPLLEGDSSQDFMPIVHMAVALKLAAVTSTALRMEVDEDLVKSLKQDCIVYHCIHVLFLTPGLTTWTMGYIVPYHTEDIFQRFGLGLGINTMQGRESKHQQIKGYLKHTPSTNAEQKWQIVSKHEYAEQLMLPLATGQDSYSRTKFEAERNKVKQPSTEALSDEVLDVLQMIFKSGEDKVIHPTLSRYVHL